jgi:hypothetical protein
MQTRLKKLFGVGLMVAATAGALALLLRPLYGKTDTQTICQDKNNGAARAERLVPPICDQMGLNESQKQQLVQIMKTRNNAIDEGARNHPGIFKDDAGRPLPPPSKAQQDEARAQVKALLGEEGGRDFMDRYFRAEAAERGTKIPDGMMRGGAASGGPRPAVAPIGSGAPVAAPPASAPTAP